MYCTGIPKGGVNNGWYHVVLYDEDHSDLKAVLREYGIETGAEDTIDDAATNREFFQKDCVDLIFKVEKFSTLLASC